MDKFPLARPGWPYVLSSLFLALVATALDVWWLALPLWLAAVFIINFFRDPPRSASVGPGVVIAPADGKVVVIEEVEHSALPGGRARMISIFMNIFDVHVNRAPISGRVLTVKHLPGGYLPADRPQAALSNERMEVLIDTGEGGVLAVTQVAGLVARRIHCQLHPGDQVQLGQRYGMIRFGSRLDVYLPLEAEVQVELGQRTRAGVTVIGEM
jgi:phosphatidylserine decarboxylase